MRTTWSSHSGRRDASSNICIDSGADYHQEENMDKAGQREEENKQEEFEDEGESRWAHDKGNVQDLSVGNGDVHYRQHRYNSSRASGGSTSQAHSEDSTTTEQYILLDAAVRNQSNTSRSSLEDADAARPGTGSYTDRPSTAGSSVSLPGAPALEQAEHDLATVRMPSQRHGRRHFTSGVDIDESLLQRDDLVVVLSEDADHGAVLAKDPKDIMPQSFGFGDGPGGGIGTEPNPSEQGKMQRDYVEKMKTNDHQGESEERKKRLRGMAKLTCLLFLVLGGLAGIVGTPIILNKVLPNPGCDPGFFFGKQTDEKFYHLKECKACPAKTFSRYGTEGMENCFCSGGFYGTNNNCTACDRGLWAPTELSRIRKSCQPIANYWKLGLAGQSCQELCREENKTVDAEGLRIWTTNVGMIDMMQLLNFNLRANCTGFQISHRSNGPFQCSQQECGAMRGVCFFPGPPLKSDVEMSTPIIARRFCPCLDLRLF